MGACASALKDKKKDVAAAPAPEPLKEEVLAAEVKEQEVEGKKEEDEAPVAKEDSNSEATKVESSMTKVEVLPVSEPAASVTPKTEETSPPAEVAVVEKKTVA